MIEFADPEKRKLPVWAQRKVEKLEAENARLKHELGNARKSILGEGHWQGLALHSHTSGLLPLSDKWDVHWYFGQKVSELNYFEHSAVVENNRSRAHLRIRNASGMPVMMLPEASNTVLVAGVEDFAV